MNDTALLRKIADDDGLLEVGRKAVEDVLVDFRNTRISLPFRGNGLVVYEEDGKRSSIIRMGPENAISIAIRAIADELDKNSPEGS